MNRIGRSESLFAFAVCHAFALLGYLAPAAGPTAPFLLYAIVLAAAFTGGLATAAVYTAMMDRSDGASSATDFTLQQSLCAMGPLVASLLSGVVADRWGHVALFGGCVLVAVAAGLLLMVRAETRRGAGETGAAGVARAARPATWFICAAALFVAIVILTILFPVAG